MATQKSNLCVFFGAVVRWNHLEMRDYPIAKQESNLCGYVCHDYPLENSMSFFRQCGDGIFMIYVPLVAPE